jgi:hypothetical protein
VTSAYRRKLEEDKKWLEEEGRRSGGSSPGGAAALALGLRTLGGGRSRRWATVLHRSVAHRDFWQDQCRAWAVLAPQGAGGAEARRAKGARRSLEPYRHTITRSPSRTLLPLSEATALRLRFAFLYHQFLLPLLAFRWATWATSTPTCSPRTWRSARPSPRAQRHFRASPRPAPALGPGPARSAESPKAVMRQRNARALQPVRTEQAGLWAARAQRVVAYVPKGCWSWRRRARMLAGGKLRRKQHGLTLGSSCSVRVRPAGRPVRQGALTAGPIRSAAARSREGPASQACCGAGPSRVGRGGAAGGRARGCGRGECGEREGRRRGGFGAAGGPRRGRGEGRGSRGGRRGRGGGRAGSGGRGHGRGRRGGAGGARGCGGQTAKRRLGRSVGS